MAKFWKNTNLMKHYFSFILTMTALLGMLALSWFKGVDINSVLPLILATYLGARTYEKTVAMKVAGSDPNSDTRQVIKDLNGDKDS